MKRLLAFFLAFLLTATLVPVLALSTASSASAAPRFGPTFNVPAPWGSSASRFRIIRTIEAAINGTRRTATDPQPVIHLSTYFLDRSSSSNALIRACRRGVSVRVILDSGITDKPARQLIAALNGDNVTDNNKDGKPDRPARTGACNSPKPKAKGARTTGEAVPEPLAAEEMTTNELQRSVTTPDDRAITWGSDGSYVKRCVKSCRGGKGAMHSKFYLFSQTGGVDDVTIVSSSNLNLGGATKGWNDAITFVRKPALRGEFARVHREMTEDVFNDGRRVQFTDGNVTARFYPIRNASRAADPTLQDLNKISCRSDYGATQIRISMFYWAWQRGKYLAEKVIALGRAGCKVSVTYGAPGKDVRTLLLNAAKRGHINLYDSRKFPLKGGDYAVRTHGKFMLVRGTFDGNRKANLVMTGSQNWTGASLVGGDEVTVNVLSVPLYNAYVGHYDRIRKHSVRVPKR